MKIQEQEFELEEKFRITTDFILKSSFPKSITSFRKSPTVLPLLSRPFSKFT
jgi:hypothetical protein